MNDLHPNHWTFDCFVQVVSTKQYQEILDKHGSWVMRNGQRANIKGRKVGPGRYEVRLENDVNVVINMAVAIRATRRYLEASELYPHADFIDILYSKMIKALDNCGDI